MRDWADNDIKNIDKLKKERNEADKSQKEKVKVL